MTTERLKRFAPFLLLALLPLVAPPKLGGQVRDILVFCILALGLNVVVGYTGLLHLGIGAFFGIGAYIAGVLTIATNPFHLDFTASLVAVNCEIRAMPSAEVKVASMRPRPRRETDEVKAEASA